jgi:hypothetical protein
VKTRRQESCSQPFSLATDHEQTKQSQQLAWLEQEEESDPWPRRADMGREAALAQEKKQDQEQKCVFSSTHQPSDSLPAAQADFFH